MEEKKKGGDQVQRDISKRSK